MIEWKHCNLVVLNMYINMYCTVLDTVDGKQNPLRVFGRNSSPRRWRGTRIGGNGSYRPPGPSETLQDPGSQKRMVYNPWSE